MLKKCVLGPHGFGKMEKNTAKEKMQSLPYIELLPTMHLLIF